MAIGMSLILEGFEGKGDASRLERLTLQALVGAEQEQRVKTKAMQ
jgi:hypothetical protein